MMKSTNLQNLVSAMASHAAQRHAVVAENIANSDTPGYKAKDLQPFSEVFHEAQMGTKPINPGNFSVTETTSGDAYSPNGNSVSLEEQMMKSAETQNDHALALMLYRKSLSMMKMAVGKNL
tara:strand:+ start:625 stop:987 length:363 start_codon:yes stop_codon:yes gene_type:complete